MHLNLEGKVILVTGKQLHKKITPIKKNPI
jgi:hypothetical protein